MKKRPIDMAAVRTARANLRRLAKQYPELTGPPGEANRRGWETTLEGIVADETNDEQLVVRLPRSLMERLDVYAERMRREMPGPAWKRSDVVRMLLARALEDVGAPKKGKR